MVDVLCKSGEPYSGSSSRDRADECAGERDSAIDEDVRGRFIGRSVP